MIRQPVVVVLGHVDSGKTSLLDKIRGTAVQAREAGGMTQHIGASFFPLQTLEKICAPLIDKAGIRLTLPGLLVIDTPGHEIFSNLRMRGGSAADIAILVVEILKGFEAQTHESLEILKRRKVPFVIALNKLDTLPGWRSTKGTLLRDSLKVQSTEVLEELDNRTYAVVGTLSSLGFQSEAYYRVKDFTKEVAIVPVSAKTGEGIPELIAVMLGLAQKYLQSRLLVEEGPAKGIVLEVKEETGLGLTANIIILNGSLRIGDAIVLGRRSGPVTTRIKSILMPKPLDEMRDPRDRFTAVNQVHAAAGVKIVAPDLEGVLPGSPVVSLSGSISEDEVKASVQSEISSVFVENDKAGLVCKADTIGSLEAMLELLRSKDIPVRLADIGPVTRRDVIEAKTVKSENSYLGSILAFNVKILPDAQAEAVNSSVKIATAPIIYNLVEDYVSWMREKMESDARAEFARLTFPSSFKILRGFIFRRSEPAIFGVEVLAGRLKQKSMVISDAGKELGEINQIEKDGKSIEVAEAGSQVAISMKDVIFGRHVFEDQVLYTLPLPEHAKLLMTKFKDRLSSDEQALLDRIVELRRQMVPLYAF